MKKLRCQSDVIAMHKCVFFLKPHDFSGHNSARVDH